MVRPSTIKPVVHSRAFPPPAHIHHGPDRPYLYIITPNRKHRRPRQRLGHARPSRIEVGSRVSDFAIPLNCSRPSNPPNDSSIGGSATRHGGNKASASIHMRDGIGHRCPERRRHFYEASFLFYIMHNGAGVIFRMIPRIGFFVFLFRRRTCTGIYLMRCTSQAGSYSCFHLVPDGT